MRTLVVACLFGIGLLPAAATGQQPARIYPVTSQCLFDGFSEGHLLIRPGEFIPFEIRSHAPEGAQTFEFSLPGFGPQEVILVLDLTPNPQATAVGDPFAEGARISFPTCQSEPVTLYTGRFFSFQAVDPLWSVEAHSSPREPGTTCATVGSCTGETSCVLAGLPRQIARSPYNPSPADGGTGVSLHPALEFSWQGSTCYCYGSVCHTLYFGEDSDPPLFFSECDALLPELDLQPSTTYYWRVRVSHCETLDGPVWSFTTEPEIAVGSTSWSNLKVMFK